MNEAGIKLEKGQALRRFRLYILKMRLRSFAEWLGVKPSHIVNIQQGREYWQTPKINKDGSITIPTEQPPPTELAEELRKRITEYRRTHSPLSHVPYTVSILNRAEKACNIIDHQTAELKQTREEILQLKTQLLSGSENDSCAIEGMDEGKP